MVRFTSPVIILALMAGCASQQPASSTAAKDPNLEEVVNSLKHELTAYTYYDTFKTDHWVYDNTTAPPRPRDGTHCPYIKSLKVKKAEVNIVTKNDTSNGVNGGIKVPLGPATANPSATHSHEVTNTNTIDLHFVPDGQLADIPADEMQEIETGHMDKLALFNSLANLRNAFEQIARDDQKPCLTFSETTSRPTLTPAPRTIKVSAPAAAVAAPPPPSPPATSTSDASTDLPTISYGFQAQTVDQLSGNVTFLVFSVGGDRDATTSKDNTITLTLSAQ
jgi:hypothetical protein